jgi:hypothetical protein
VGLDQLADAVGTRWLAWREGGGGSLACTRGLHAGAKEVSCCTYRGLAADAEKGGGDLHKVGREHATCIANYAGGRKVNKRGNDPYIVSASCSYKASHDSTLCALSPTIHPPRRILLLLQLCFYVCPAGVGSSQVLFFNQTTNQDPRTGVTAMSVSACVCV